MSIGGETAPAGRSSVEQQITLTIDACEREVVQLFWLAALGYERRDDQHLTDPRGHGPAIYFQPLDCPRSQRNRVHVDVWLDEAECHSRVAAALAAGGTLISDTYAPRWWVLADSEGNEVCIAVQP